MGSFANPHTFPAPTSSNQVTGAVRWNLLATATRENVLFDQVFQVRACINGTVTCTISYPITLDRVGNGGARASAGPGSVSMVTGNLSLSASDVDIVGASSLAAGHLTLVPQLKQALADMGRPDIMVVVGGVIPPQDFDALLDAGAAAIFPPGTVISTAAEKLLQQLLELRA